MLLIECMLGVIFIGSHSTIPLILLFVKVKKWGEGKIHPLKGNWRQLGQST